MTCNDPCFIHEMNVIKNTWAKPVLDGKYDNLDIWFYTSGDKNYIDIDNHIIYVDADDSLYGTWEKTLNTFNIINKYFDYDFIFRTNCSTVINCQLLSTFINYLDINTNEFWAIDYMFEKNYIIMKDLNYIIPYGFGIIISNNIIHKLINNYNIEYLYYNNLIHKYTSDIFSDDNMLALIVNHINEIEQDSIKYVHFNHAYYKSYDKEFVLQWYNYDVGNTKLDINIFKNVLGVRIKKMNRENYSYKSDYILSFSEEYKNICEVSNVYNENIIDKQELDIISQNIINNRYNYEIRIIN